MMERLMAGKAGKNTDLLQAKFRKLFLEPESDNWTSLTGHGLESENETFNSDRFDDKLRLLFEGIEYNRATVEMGTNFAKVFTALGLITLCINLVILAILASHKRLVLQQVFYLLIINFAIIDASKGVCLASHALRFALPPSVYEDRVVLATRIDQYVNILFRLFNLATIFNLLMITLNEFIYIKFPLRYHQLIRRRLVVTLVGVSWVITIVFTVASSVAKSKDDTVLISTDANDTQSPDEGGSYKSKHIRRTETAADTADINTVFTFALTGFCVFSLLVVLICYAIFFKVIREIQKHDSRLFSDANFRRSSETSVECGDMQHLDERKLKRQLLKRYKYVLVIGSVILVYLLYLISYSSIQILQYFNLSRRAAPMTLGRMRSMLITRWILVLLCGLHSTIQPICYFRMKEFREIVVRIFGYPCKCGRRRGIDRSEYFSSLGDTSTPLATNCNTPQQTAPALKTSKTLPQENSNENADEYEMKSPRPSALRQSYANGLRVGRQHSVVHFEEGTALLVSTLSRRPSGFLTESNEML